MIGHVTLGDGVDARAAIAVAKDAFGTYSKSSLEERGAILQRLHDAIAARGEDHLEAMAIEYGAGRLRSEATVGRAVKAFANVRDLLGQLPWEQPYGDVRAPIGGFKMSGLGREFGLQGIEEYLETKSIFAR